MNRLIGLGLACLTGLALMAPGAAAAADVALVIGNHDYRRAPDALSARLDARAVAEALEAGGYEVVSGTDLSRSEMQRSIARFADRVDDADRAVVFYSGHALRTGGLTYLAPVDQDNDSLVEVMMGGVPLDLVLRLAGEASGQAVVFVDGAQLDGFTPRAYAEPGLAHIDAPDGVLVVSAAAPGRAIPRRSERRSAFARQVVDEFLAPGASIGRAVRRLDSPGWVGGDTDSSLVLVPEGRAADRDDDRDDDRSARTASEIEARLNLTARERRGIQRNLVRLGYDTRGTDGIFGAGTRAAIRGWQRSNDRAVTGYLTQEQVAAINRQGSEAASGPSGPTPAEVEARLNLTRAERSDIQERFNALGYDTRGTGGVFGSGTRTAIRNWQRANDFDETGYLTQEQVSLVYDQSGQAGTGTGGRTAAEVEAALNLTGAERSEIQERLNMLGYDTRGTDGVFGFGTRTAIRNWQRANDFEETGYLTDRQISLIFDQSRQAGRPPRDDTASAPENPAAAEDRLGLTRTDRLSVEQRLAYLGFPPGPQDGFFDEDTRWAIEGYQRSRGYPVTGYLDRQTVAGLVDETQGVRTGIVSGAQVLFDILRGLGGQQ